MEQRELVPGRLICGVIGMGTWRTFDVSPSDRSAVALRTAITSEAIEAGVNLFDSSPMYGQAEAVLGIALQDRRADVIVATKVWSSSIAEGRRQIERALQYYDGYVDLYQVHNLVAWREYLPILRELQAEGQIGAIGITHYSRSAFPQMRQIMETQGIAAIQIPYNAAEYAGAEEMLQAAAAQRIGVLVMSPLGTGDLLRNPPAEKELTFLHEFGIRTWAQALLKWVVSDPRVAATIPATGRSGRMTENAAAGAPPFFGAEERERISRLAQRVAR